MSQPNFPTENNQNTYIPRAHLFSLPAFSFLCHQPDEAAQQQSEASIDLSAISTGSVDVPDGGREFELSEELQIELCSVFRNRTPFDTTDLLRRVSHEAHQFATSRKEHVRDVLKERQRTAEQRSQLSVSDRSRLRSRREARVSRVRQRAYEGALKNLIRWVLRQNVVALCSQCKHHGA